VSAGLLAVLTFAALVIQRGLELRVARSNERAARARGAVEHGAGHYPLFFVLHGAWMLGWPLEAYARGLQLDPRWPLWLGAFAGAQLLRYWAISSLGSRWNTRVLVVPGDRPLQRGPYRWLAHPNYVAVAIELACVPLVFGAWTTALLASVANAIVLIAIRIPCERRALAWASAAPSAPPAAATDRTPTPRG
jgi:methyltransferase